MPETITVTQKTSSELMRDYIDSIERRHVKNMAYARHLSSSIGEQMIASALLAVKKEIALHENYSTLNQIDNLKKKISSVYEAELRSGMGKILADLNLFSIAEAAFIYGEMRRVVPGILSLPSDAFISRSVGSSVMSLNGYGYSIDDFVNEFIFSSQNKINQTITQVWRESKLSPDPIVQKLNSRLKSLSSGAISSLMDKTVTTLTSHHSSAGRMSLYEKNQDAIERYYISVTFDNRISHVCISLGSKYGLDSGGISLDELNRVGMPPYHWYCRSIVLPFAQGMSGMFGDKNALNAGDKEAYDAAKARDKSRGGSGVVRYSGRKGKAIKSEQIKQATPLANWLNKQPNWFQDEVLGKSLGDAYRAGKIDLAELTTKSLKPKTLQELGVV